MALDCIKLRHDRQDLEQLLVLAPMYALDSRVTSREGNIKKGECIKEAKNEKKAQEEAKEAAAAQVAPLDPTASEEKAKKKRKADADKSKRTVNRKARVLEVKLSKRTGGDQSTTSSQAVSAPTVHHAAPSADPSTTEDGFIFSMDTPTTMKSGMPQHAADKRKRAPTGGRKKVQDKVHNVKPAVATSNTQHIADVTHSHRTTANAFDARVPASGESHAATTSASGIPYFEQQLQDMSPAFLSGELTPVSTQEFAGLGGLEAASQATTPAAEDILSRFHTQFDPYDHQAARGDGTNYYENHPPLDSMPTTPMSTAPQTPYDYEIDIAMEEIMAQQDYEFKRNLPDVPSERARGASEEELNRWNSFYANWNPNEWRNTGTEGVRISGADETGDD